MLNRAGFTKIQVRYRRRTSWLRASARLARVQQRSWKTWLAGTRLGASALGWCACLARQGDCLQAVAVKN
jgi:hypothetical protein